MTDTRVRPASPAVQARFERARALLQAACDAHQGKSCAVLALLYQGTGLAPDPAKVESLTRRAIDDLEASCLAGTADDCMLAHSQIQYQGGQVLFGKPRGGGDPERAARLLNQGCKLGSGEACTVLGKRATSNPAADRALLFTAGCDDGWEDACFELADIQHTGASSGAARGFAGVVSLQTGIRLARAHCDLGETRGCDSLAASLTLNAVPSEEAKRTVDYLEKVCDRGALMTCNTLAQALLHGPEALRDPERGERLKKKACDLGYPFACPDPMAKLGIFPQLGTPILDRRTGLEWAPPSRREQTLAAASDECKALPAPDRIPFHLPSRSELDTLRERDDELRVFARASLPSTGFVLSSDTPWAMSLPGGRIVEGTATRPGLAFCVRKPGAAARKGQVLALRMRGKDLEVELRDARGKVLTTATIPTPEEVPPAALAWDMNAVKGPVDVDVAPEVSWRAAARFLDHGKVGGLALGRIAIGK
jgi:TPR repeat protein